MKPAPCPQLAWLGVGVGVFVVIAAALPLRSAAQSTSAATGSPCGEVVKIETHQQTHTRYALVPPPISSTQGPPVTLALVVGGAGHLDLDPMGCPRALRGNSLVRALPLFHASGFGTALVDAPSDHHGADGLAGFRNSAAHADDLGRVIADLRTRTQGTVWLIGTSRGTISAVNAGARLVGGVAPDGLVLTSALMSGQYGARKAWVAQTVFDSPLETIRVPVLLVGHALDRCARSPATLMAEISTRLKSPRTQVVTVSGGPGRDGPSSLDACEGRSPHGFITQEAELVSGIARFIRGGQY